MKKLRIYMKKCIPDTKSAVCVIWGVGKENPDDDDNSQKH